MHIASVVTRIYMSVALKKIQILTVWARTIKPRDISNHRNLLADMKWNSIRESDFEDNLPVFFYHQATPMIPTLKQYISHQIHHLICTPWVLQSDNSFPVNSTMKFQINLERMFPGPITHANGFYIQKRKSKASKTLLSGHAKFVGSFSASDISSTAPPVPPFSPEAKNRNCNRFLRELANKEEPAPLLLRKLGNSALHCFAPPETTKRMLMQCNNY